MSQFVWPSRESEALVIGSQIGPKDPRFSMLITDRNFRWSEFINLAMEHRVQGILASAVKPYRSEIPTGICKILEVAGRHIAERSALFAEEIKTLFRLFNQKGIRVVLLKGPRLLIDVYPDTSMRPFNDIDLLTDRNDVAEVSDALRTLGYGQYESVDGQLVPMTQILLKRYEEKLQHLGEFARATGRPIMPHLWVDLHHRLTTVYDSYQFDPTPLVWRSKQKFVDDVPVWVLDDSDHLIQLCVHLYSNTRAIKDIQELSDLQLIRFVDVAESIRALSIDWDHVQAMCSESPSLRIPVGVALLMAEILYGPLVPPPLRESFDTPEIVSNVDAIADRWTQDSDEPIGRWPIPFQSRLFDSDRVRYAYEAFYKFHFRSLERERGHQR